MPRKSERGCCPPVEIEELARELDVVFFLAMSEPIRLGLLRLLIFRGPMDVESIAAEFPQDRSVISRHLSALRNADILRSQRDGRRVIYCINGAGLVLRIERLLSCVKHALMACCPEELSRRGRAVAREGEARARGRPVRGGD